MYDSNFDFSIESNWRLLKITFLAFNFIRSSLIASTALPALSDKLLWRKNVYTTRRENLKIVIMTVNTFEITHRIDEINANDKCEWELNGGEVSSG